MSSLPGFEVLPEGVCRHPGIEEREAKPRLKEINRNQMLLRPIDVENFIPSDHRARAIWDLAGQIDLALYYKGIKAVEGRAGSTAFDPRLLVSIWVYSYSEGIGSSREISRRIGYDPAYQWLTAMEPINYHTLSDFRSTHEEALRELFVNILAVMSSAGLITLESVMHDGMKVKANAGSDSFRREGTLKDHLEAAEELVKRLEETSEEEVDLKREKARERAVRERKDRVKKALSELSKIRQTKSSSEDKENARASMTDPDARIMKFSGTGGYGPAYNLQISTDSTNTIIVAAEVSRRGDDYRELIPAMERIEETTGRSPSQVVADGGFTSRENIIAMDAKCIDFIGSFDEGTKTSAGQMKRRGVDPAFWPDRFSYDETNDAYTCPEGKILSYLEKEERIGKTNYTYQARRQDCRSCPHQEQCCPGKLRQRSLVRGVDHPVVAAFIDKMKTDEAKAIYKKRGAIAEFPNAWIKEKLGLRQFHLRGLIKVGMEALWACVTYNIQQWIRLVWRPQLV
jgi:transposase